MPSWHFISAFFMDTQWTHDCYRAYSTLPQMHAYLFGVRNFTAFGKCSCSPHLQQPDYVHRKQLLKRSVRRVVGYYVSIVYHEQRLPISHRPPRHTLRVPGTQPSLTWPPDYPTSCLNSTAAAAALGGWV